MAEDTEFQERIQRIESLVRRLEAMPDKNLWAAVRELVQSVMDLHSVALDRMLAILREYPMAPRATQSDEKPAPLANGNIGTEPRPPGSGLLTERDAEGTRLVEALSNDELVGSLMLLHGIHPIDLETRVRRALEKIETILRGYGAHAELLDASDGNIQIRVRSVSSAVIAKSSRAAIEDAIFQAAPDITSLAILGLEQFGPANFVPLDQLQMASAATNGHDAAHAGRGGV